MQSKGEREDARVCLTTLAWLLASRIDIDVAVLGILAVFQGVELNLGSELVAAEHVLDAVVIGVGSHAMSDVCDGRINVNESGPRE